MKLHTDLQKRKFDRIIFNFPHAGFHGKEDSVRMIRRHQNLMRGFFKNASGMLRANGEIHVNHKTSAPFCFWNLEEIAALNSSLVLIECVDFWTEDYPGYNNKKGDGPRCDDPFPLGECSTFKFIISPNAKKMFMAKSRPGLTRRSFSPIPFQPRPTLRDFDHHVPEYALPPPSDIRDDGFRTFRGHPGLTRRSLSPIPFQLRPHFGHHVPESTLPPPPSNIRDNCFRIFDRYFKYAVETFGRTDHNLVYSVHEELRYGYERYMGEAPGRSLNGYISHLEELHQLSLMRSAWLKRRLWDPDH